jgi:hypothetical protein
MSDKIADYTETLEGAVTSVTRELASWRSFADKSRELPIVTYRASLNGVKSVDAVSDLSELSAGDSQAVKSILSQHHGERAVRVLHNIETIAKKFREHLTQTPQEVEEDIPEASYPEGNHGNNIDDFE